MYYEYRLKPRFNVNLRADIREMSSCDNSRWYILYLTSRVFGSTNKLTETFDTLKEAKSRVRTEARKFERLLKIKIPLYYKKVKTRGA